MRNATIKRGELAKLFHLKGWTPNHPVSLLPVLDDGEWHMWAPGGQDGQELWPVKGFPVEGEYWAKKPEQHNDVWFSFPDFFQQYAMREWNDHYVNAIRNDIYHLGACWSKLESYYWMREEWKMDVRAFVETELEYLFVKCRSMFDLIQRLMAAQWQHIQWKDAALEAKRKSVTLPPSFADIALKGNAPRDVNDIQERWGFPPEFAQFYRDHAEFFEKLRRNRDHVAHGGKDIQWIYDVKGGFAIPSDDPFFAGLHTWPESQMLPNSLAPLNPFVAQVINQTLGALDAFTRLIAKSLLWPGPIAPGYKIYLRGHHIYRLAELPIETTDNPYFEARPAKPYVPYIEPPPG